MLGISSSFVVAHCRSNPIDQDVRHAIAPHFAVRYASIRGVGLGNSAGIKNVQLQQASGAEDALASDTARNLVNSLPAA